MHLRIIDDETQILSPDDAAKADAVLAGMTGPLTFGKLRSAAHRLVLELDPEAAAKRKDAGGGMRRCGRSGRSRGTRG